MIDSFLYPLYWTHEPACLLYPRLAIWTHNNDINLFFHVAVSRDLNWLLPNCPCVVGNCKLGHLDHIRTDAHLLNLGKITVDSKL